MEIDGGDVSSGLKDRLRACFGKRSLDSIVESALIPRYELKQTQPNLHEPDLERLQEQPDENLDYSVQGSGNQPVRTDAGVVDGNVTVLIRDRILLIPGFHIEAITLGVVNPHFC
jgi:hypothetical protein